MPMIPNEREYRDFTLTVIEKEDDEETKEVRGYASTFNQPYTLYEDDEVVIQEQVSGRAFDNADMSDVIFQHNHEGKCFARTKMRAGTAPTLILEPQESGLFIAADLGMIAEGREEYAAITGGLVYQMSFAFTVADDEIIELGDREYLRTIKAIKKVYDVSSVDMPANPNTSIDTQTRAAFEGFIEQRAQELRRIEEEAIAKRKLIALINL